MDRLILMHFCDEGFDVNPTKVWGLAGVSTLVPRVLPRKKTVVRERLWGKKIELNGKNPH